jgi:uncharacterized protein (TIGR03000 family)
MVFRKCLSKGLRFPLLAALLLWPGLASAQCRIVARLSFGPPTDPNIRESLENGQTGPAGYSAVYGNYPFVHTHIPSIVITNQLPPPLALVDMPATTALIRVRVPADAEIWFSGEKTTQRGDWRLFYTPILKEGQSLDYEVRARWKQDGKDMDQTRKITVSAGDRLTIDFLRPASEDLPVLPPPRKEERRGPQ